MRFLPGLVVLRVEGFKGAPDDREAADEWTAAWSSNGFRRCVQSSDVAFLLSEIKLSRHGCGFLLSSQGALSAHKNRVMDSPLGLGMKR